MHVIPSLKHKNIRYRLGYNDNAFRYPKAMAHVSFFDTMGDGNTAHTPDTPVCTIDAVPDVMASCREALRIAIHQNHIEMIETIRGAVHVCIGIEAETAMKACKAAMSEKQYYLCNKEVVRGDKYANRRDAEPLMKLPADAGCLVQSLYRQTLLAGQYPNVLEIVHGAWQADLDEFPYALKQLCEDNAIPTGGDGSLREAIRDLKDINQLLWAHRILHNFTASLREEKAA